MEGDNEPNRVPSTRPAVAGDGAADEHHIKTGETTTPRMSYDVLDPSLKRYAHLDLARVLCVALVTIDHGAWIYSAENTLFAQSWVLQWLWLISGVCFTLGRAPLIKQLPRLGLIFIVGAVLNWVAWLVAGWDWKNNIADVVFQFWFIVGLMIFMSICAHLKPLLLPGGRRPYLRSRENNVTNGTDALKGGDLEVQASDEVFPTGINDRVPSERDRVNDKIKSRHQNNSATTVEAGKQSGRALQKDERDALLKYGILVFVLLALQTGLGIWAMGLEGDSLKKSLESAFGGGASFWADGLQPGQIIGQLTTLVGAVLLANIGARLLRSPRLSPWLAWVVLAWLYICRSVLVPCLFGQTGLGRIITGFGLFLSGLISACRGLEGASILRLYGVRYWWMVALALALLWNPTWSQRFDERPPEDWFMSWRVVTSEFVCTVGFLTVGECMFDPKIFTEDKAAWLSDLGLLLFVVHRAIHVAVPQPWNWIVLISLSVPMWWRRRGPSVSRLIRGRGSSD